MVLCEARLHRHRVELFQRALQEYEETFIGVDASSDVSWLVRSTYYHAHRAVTILGEFIGAGGRILDVGIGCGFSFHLITGRYPHAVGVDVDAKAVKVAKELLDRDASTGNILAGDGCRLPFPNDTFDAIICNTTIEHVEDPQSLLRDLNRVLKPDGVLYLTAPNRLWPIEGHFGLPFLSYLPKRWANLYLRIMGRRGTYDNIHPPTYGQFHRQARPFFKVSDRTLEVVQEYERYGTDKDRGPLVIPVSGVLRWLGRARRFPGPLIARAFRWALLRLAPGWIWVCTPIKGR